MNVFILTGWLVMVFFLSVIPVPDVGAQEELPLDKIVHVVFYGVAGILIYRVLHQRSYKKNVLMYSILISSLYGGFIEVVQYFIPYRSMSLGDMAANTLGAVLFVILYDKRQKTVVH